MGTIASWLGAIVGALGVRVLLALGIGFVSFAGLSALKSELQSMVSQYLGQMPGDVYAIAAKVGMIDAIGIWLSAIAAALTWIGLKRLAVLS